MTNKHNRKWRLPKVWYGQSPIGLGILFCIGIMIAIIVAHRSGSLPAIAPYALFLLCPLMHLVMHGAMHNHHRHPSERSSNRRS